MNMLKKPDRGQFTIGAVKSPKRDSLTIEAHSMVVDGPESYKIPYKGPFPVVPHPTLLGCFDKLKPYFAEYFGYTHFESVVKENLFGAKKEQLKMAEEVTSAFMSEIKVTGISYPGSNRDGVIITGTYKGCAMNTKKMYFSNENHGKDLEVICDELDDEVFEYMFNGKKAQLDMFDEESDSQEEDNSDEPAA